MEHLRKMIEALGADRRAHTVNELDEAAEAAGVDVGDGNKSEKMAAAAAVIAFVDKTAAAAAEAAAAALAAEKAAAAALAAEEAAAAEKAAAAALAAEEAAAAAEKAAAEAAAAAAVIAAEEAALLPIEVNPNDSAMLTALLTMFGIVGKPAGSTMTAVELRDGIRAVWMTFAPLLQDVLAAGHVPPAPSAPPNDAARVSSAQAATNAQATAAMEESGIPVLVPAKPGGEVIVLPQPPKTGVFAINSKPPQPVNPPSGVFAEGIPVLSPGNIPDPLTRGDGRTHRVINDRLPILKPDGA